MSLDAKGLRRQLTADKKKFGLLMGLCVFGLLLWGRLMLNGGVPRTATATPAMITAAAPADNNAPKGLTSLRRVVEVAMTTEVKRDLFKADVESYQQIPDEKKPGEQGERPKLPLDPAEELLKKQEMIRAEARKLSLQSTLLGSSPRAMISRVLVSVGEKIQGFELVEIRSRQVTLRKDGVTVILEM